MLFQSIIVDTSQDLIVQSLCGENGYYCKIPGITANSEESESIILPLSSSDHLITADIEEINMTFEYPSLWGGLDYSIRPGFDGNGFILFINFSNNDRVKVGGLSSNYDQAFELPSSTDFSGFGVDQYFNYFESSSCKSFYVNNYREEGFINLLNCEEINVSNNIKALDYFLTHN